MTIRLPGALRGIIVFLGLVLLWQGVVSATGVVPYILPAPLEVATVLVTRFPVILPHALVTAAEIVAGLTLGSVLGAACALALAYFRPARRWLMPVLIASQAIPTFALAPILVLWLGYGMPSKVAMAALVDFFPVATAFFDGLRRTEPGWLDLARTMGGARWRVLVHIRLPAALPALGSGLRVAAAVAPIGAVIGEWVGSSAGLGYLMLQSNARLQIAMVFACLAVLAAMAMALYAAVDRLIRAGLPWQPDTLPENEKD